MQILSVNDRLVLGTFKNLFLKGPLCLLLLICAKTMCDILYKITTDFFFSLSEREVEYG